MNKKNIFTFTILILGIMGTVVTWKIRYDSAYEIGFLIGESDGNQTGYSIGYEKGYVDGWNKGEADGILVGKKLGSKEGEKIGYKEGFDSGETDGFRDGYFKGNLTGISLGYIAGIVAGSSEYEVRDPILEELLTFLEFDKTNEYDISTGYYFHLSSLRENAFEHGFRTLWVYVEMKGDRTASFCGFNTIDSGLVFVECRYDLILELKVGDPCWDREHYTAPEYDDTITKITFIS